MCINVILNIHILTVDIKGTPKHFVVCCIKRNINLGRSRVKRIVIEIDNISNEPRNVNFNLVAVSGLWTQTKQNN